MKKTLLLCAFVAALVSCKKESPEPQIVDFSVDYTFAESGTMKSSSAAEIYNNFYTTAIKNKQYTPKRYNLKFSNAEGKVVAIAEGRWGAKDLIRLPEGEYTVTGSSRPNVNNYYPSDSVYIAFNEKISVTKDTKAINLTAKYDSFLLMFDAENTGSVIWRLSDKSGYQKEYMEIGKLGEVYYFFFKQLPDGQNQMIVYKKEGGAQFDIALDNIPFEIGKYYYFNNATGSFDIPPMEPGN